MAPIAAPTTVRSLKVIWGASRSETILDSSPFLYHVVCKPERHHSLAAAPPNWMVQLLQSGKSGCPRMQLCNLTEFVGERVTAQWSKMSFGAQGTESPCLSVGLEVAWSAFLADSERP